MSTEILIPTIAILGSAIAILYRRLAKVDAAQERRLLKTEQRLERCEDDRVSLHKEVKDIWKWIGTGRKPDERDSGKPTPPV
jgi:hypothetical protein